MNWLMKVRLLNFRTIGAICALAGFEPRATEVVPETPAAILQELRSFGTVATILHVAAHPDDENTALITYFARGRGYRTAYLSLTRGDGGQNEIGPEFDEKLGVARTQELLAARKLDGGRQFFTRAIDFGYSKSAEETLRFWDREQVLGDVVRIIRQFRPDVIVTRFPIPPGSGGHGHHTASGILGVEAFKLAGDPKAYPEQLQQGLTVWQPKRVAWNGGAGGRGGAAPAGPTVRVDIGGTDPVTSEPFSQIAARSRGMHITQGFGGFGGREGGGGPNVQTFTIFGGDPAEKDLMDGIDTTWNRIPRGAEIGTLTEAAIAEFKTDNPSGSILKLLAIRAKLGALDGDPVVLDKRRQLDRILQACLGLSVRTTAGLPEVVPGERLKLSHTVKVTAGAPIQWVGVRSSSLSGQAFTSTKLSAGQVHNVERDYTTRKDLSMTQPYWLQEEGRSGLFRVDDPNLIGTPENAPSFPVEYLFEIEGQTLSIPDEAVYVEKGSGQEKVRRLDVIPPVSIRFASDVTPFKFGATRALKVEVIAARPMQTGILRLEMPPGWKAVPSEQSFRVEKAGEKAHLTFTVTSPARQTSDRITASALIDGVRYSNQRIEINYTHLPFMLLQPSARTRVVSVDYDTRGKNVGYLPGAGDSIEQMLTELGYNVTRLEGADLIAEKLNALDAVVVGVRAFNERSDLGSKVTNLFNFVENGGTLVVQYNRPNGLRTQPLGPYTLSIQGPAPQLRVTDERAPVTFLSPEHPVLTTPNKITSADFEGWFQERGAYFPSNWDKERYTTVLAMSDPGERPLESSILVTKHGKGHYVYTGVAFFRQLPAGVPGAFRLFANLVSLGK